MSFFDFMVGYEAGKSDTAQSGGGGITIRTIVITLPMLGEITGVVIGSCYLCYLALDKADLPRMAVMLIGIGAMGAGVGIWGLINMIFAQSRIFAFIGSLLSGIIWTAGLLYVAPGFRDRDFDTIFLDLVFFAYIFVAKGKLYGLFDRSFKPTPSLGKTIRSFFIGGPIGVMVAKFGRRNSSSQ